MAPMVRDVEQRLAAQRRYVAYRAGLKARGLEATTFSSDAPYDTEGERQAFVLAVFHMMERKRVLDYGEEKS